jgi:hypothetical protein
MRKAAEAVAGPKGLMLGLSISGLLWAFLIGLGVWLLF